MTMSTLIHQEDLKAGHGPALRVGNMRVKTHKHNSTKERVRKGSENEEFEEISTSPKQHLVISGAVTKGDLDFPPEAIRAFHEKPLAHCDFRNQHKSNIIQQPKKF